MSTTTDAPPGTALVLIDKGALSTILAADTENIFGRLQDDLRDFKRDGSTEKGRKECASAAKKISGAKADLLRLAADQKASHYAVIKGIIAEEKIVEEKFDTLRDWAKQPKVDYEEREKKRVQAHEAAIVEIQAWTAVPMDCNSAQIRTRWEQCRQHSYHERDWQEFDARAKYEMQAAEAALERLYQRLAKEEADAAELARLRAEAAERQRIEAERQRQEREAEIARQAAERARQQAEADAARMLQAAQEEAARKLREAEERAAEEAAQVKRDRQAEEQRAADALAEVERAAQRLDYARRMVQHIVNCGLGFIDDQPQPYGILFRELDEKIVYDADTFGPLLHEAIVARETAIGRLKAGMEAVKSRREAEERAEAERHAAAERERLAAQRAADEARQAAEREAVQARRAEAAEAQAKAAREQAERDAEAAVERERQRVAAETAKAEADAKAREADLAHRGRINTAAVEALVKVASLTDVQAKAVVRAIAKGQVPAIRIEY